MDVARHKTVPVIPLPRDVEVGEGTLDLGGSARPPVSVAFPPGLEGAGHLVKEMLPAITGKEVNVLANADAGEAGVGIALSIDQSLPVDTYRVVIGDAIALAGGSTRALQWAIASLLQLVDRPEPSGTPWRAPRCKITDAPAYPYIGLLVDLARRWHPVDDVKRCILLCWWYKVKYIHLHFTDNQSFTLPSPSFPRLPTWRRNYKRGEIAALNDFARHHGVTVVPEIDLPGHSRALVRAYPRLFGLEPLKLGRPVHDGVVNIGKEAAIDALSTIIKETCDLFPDSPYFHLGADEVDYRSLEGDPDVVRALEARGLGNVEELYREFIDRMHGVVAACGKRMCAWEGFGPEGKVPIPKDIPVFVFESLYNTADRLVADGYQVVNTSWQPIYVTRKRHWTPEKIYTWNPTRWENFV
ncbi:MAG: family 20 glycosylhydrolase, partial [Candidatus Lokiarchaeota archaeon]|nr:family 20 glycosylhydrolase [Candidatus Lokiarchaeota archaeon]